MPAMWKMSLPAVVETRDGATFKTLKDAAEFTAEQPHRNEWLRAAEALLQAAESGRSSGISTAHTAFRNALFLDGLRLKL
jgi:hypothetical protein